MVEVGQKYYFKLSKSRGRPYVGEVIRRSGIFTEMENNGKIFRVPTKLVGRPYSFKPYNKYKIAG